MTEKNEYSDKVESDIHFVSVCNDEENEVVKVDTEWEED